MRDSTAVPLVTIGPMTTVQGDSPRERLWPTFGRAITELFRAAPAETSLLTLILILQGLIPAAALYLTKLTVDGVTRLAQGGEASLALVLGGWLLSLVLGSFSRPLTRCCRATSARSSPRTSISP